MLNAATNETDIQFVSSRFFEKTRIGTAIKKTNTANTVMLINTRNEITAKVNV